MHKYRNKPSLTSHKEFDKTRPCVNKNQTSDEIAIGLSLQKEWHKMDISLLCLVPILRQCESLLLAWMAHLKTNKLKLKHNGTNLLQQSREKKLGKFRSYKGRASEKKSATQ